MSAKKSDAFSEAIVGIFMLAVLALLEFASRVCMVKCFYNCIFSSFVV